MGYDYLAQQMQKVIIMLHAVFLTVETTIDPLGDGQHVTSICKIIQSATPPEPAGTVYGSVFFHELVGILYQCVVLIQILTTSGVVITTSDLNNTPTSESPTVACGFGAIAHATTVHTIGNLFGLSDVTLCAFESGKILAEYLL